MFFNEILSNVSIIENEEIEFKEKLNERKSNTEESDLDVFPWLKTVCGFSNKKGGCLYLGVRDSDKMLIGFTAEEIDKEKLIFSKEVSSRIYPIPQYSFNVIPYVVNNKTRYILMVRVNPSKIKPITLTIKGIPGIYIRRDGYTNGATYEEIRDMVASSASYAFDKLPTNIRFDPNDFKKLFSYYKEVNKSDLTIKKLISIGFINEDGNLLNGSLLFKDDYKDLVTIQCSLFNGITKGNNKIVTINNYSGSILDSLNYAIDFVKARMNTTIIKESIGRKEIPAYPDRSLTEAIINALAHRDYTIANSQIQVEIFKDRLQITSPGSFYSGQEISKTYDLANIISKRRNDLISNILVSLKLMESAGSGFDKITDDYKNYDEAHKPFIFSTSNQFTIVLPDLTYDAGIENKINSISYSTSIEFKANKNDESILKLCLLKQRSALEIANAINVTNSSYLRSNIIGRLVDEGLLITLKQGNESFYRTNTTRVKDN